MLTAEVEKLTKARQSSRSIAGQRGSRGRCWSCGQYTGHFQHEYHVYAEKQSNVQSVSCHKMGTIVVKGAINNVSTDMLVDTGSVVTLLSQDAWSCAVSPKLEDPERPVSDYR